MITLHPAFCDYCSTIEGESELSRNKHRTTVHQVTILYHIPISAPSHYDTDPSRWFRFLTSITNTTITDKITQSELLPQTLQQCFEKALRLEASLQLSEGVNMAHKITVMNVEVDADD